MKRLNKPLDYAKVTIDTMTRKFDAAELPPKGGFHYHQGVFLSGIYSNYLLYRDEAWFQYMKDWVDSVMDKEGNIYVWERQHLDDIQAGNLLFPLYRRTGDKKYKRALDDLMDAIKVYPKNKEGGFWHLKRFRDQMWLDGLYMAGPFVCKYANAFEYHEYYDISVTQALLMQEKTKDSETGLWYHAYDCERKAEWADKETGRSPEFWGRSIGWVPIAVLEELDYIPKEHGKYNEMCSLVRDLLVSICNFQSEDGRWYQVVDKGGKEGNWLETSCSCLYVAALYKAIRKGILEDKYLEQADKGYNGVINSLSWDGEDIQIGNVCIGTGVGDYKHYCERPTSINDLHGVGAFLIMCGEAQRISDEKNIV